MSENHQRATFCTSTGDVGDNTDRYTPAVVLEVLSCKLEFWCGGRTGASRGHLLTCWPGVRAPANTR